MASCYKDLACMHGEALLCAVSTVSIVATLLVAVTVKMKPKMRKTTYSYHRLPGCLTMKVKASRLCCMCMM